MPMLSDVERRILEIMSQKLLTTKHELSVELSRERYDGTDVSVERLREMGFVDKVESLGNCLVITQSGLRQLKDHV